MAVRDPNNILIGGGRCYVDDKELGWLSGEVKLEEQASSQSIKESEGGTVLVIATDKEVHFTFNLLEADLDTLKTLNPSASARDGGGFAVGTFQSDNTFEFLFKHQKRDGSFRCLKIFKGKISGSFTALLLNQDNASPIPFDVIAIPDDSRNSNNNLYEVYEEDEQAEHNDDTVNGGA